MTELIPIHFIQLQDYKQLHQGTKGTTRKQSAIQQHSNCLTVGSVFSSATVILVGGIVGAPGYIESSGTKADNLLEEASFVLQAS